MLTRSKCTFLSAVVLNLLGFIKVFEFKELPPCRGSVCLEISSCASILKERRVHRPEICGWTENIPFVCCYGFELTSGACVGGVIYPPEISLGILSEIDRIPWMVAFLDKDPNRSAVQRLFCGGSLITNKHILTAAHCFGERENLDEIEVAMGNNNIEEDSPNRFAIEKIIVHPDFALPIWYNDIAIVRLQKPINLTSSMSTICLPLPSARNLTFESSVVTIAGWGNVGFLGNVSENLLEADLKVWSNEKCNETFMTIPGTERILPKGITDNIICGGSYEGKDACAGDSGGPMFMWDDQNPLLIGVVGSGYKCGIPGMPAMYARVTAYVDWIEENLDE